MAPMGTALAKILCVLCCLAIAGSIVLVLFSIIGYVSKAAARRA